MTLAEIFQKLLSMEAMRTEAVTPNMVMRIEGSAALKMHEAPNGLRITHIQPQNSHSTLYISYKHSAPVNANTRRKHQIALPEELSIL